MPPLDLDRKWGNSDLPPECPVHPQATTEKSLPFFLRDDFLRASTKPRLKCAGAQLAVVDLFSGCGGLSLGAFVAAHERGLALRPVVAVDVDETARTVYGHNFEPELGTCEEIRVDFLGNPGLLDAVAAALRDSRWSLLLAGPPCQGHSDLNNSTRRDDPRNELYRTVADAAATLQPTFILIENVPGVTNATSQVAQRTRVRLEELGYCVQSEVVKLAQLGVPQTRKRHVAIASRIGDLPTVGNLLAPFVRPAPRSVNWAIGDLTDLNSKRAIDRAASMSAENCRRAEWLIENDEYDLPNPLRPTCHREGGHSYKSMYGRLRPNEPAQTLTTGFLSPGQGRFIHPTRRRCITPHEAARIQMFPDWFDFSCVSRAGDLARLIGNAVPSTLAACVTLALLDYAEVQYG